MNADDSECVRMAEGLKSKALWFSRKNEARLEASVRQSRFTIAAPTTNAILCRLRRCKLKGSHNAENVLAAVCIGIAAGCMPEQIRSAVKAFKAVEHRLEYAATVGGVQYYNDSKATNVDATIKALVVVPGKHPHYSWR